MRLDKFVCETTFKSRKDSKDIIKKGLITVNAVIEKDPSKNIDEDNDEIMYSSKKLVYEKYVYFMLNKPENVVSANKDNLDKTVIDLFKDENRNDLSCVGRLDKDTTGILLVTNDGELIHHLTSPSHHVPKTYFVSLKEVISDEAIKQLEEGVLLTGDGLTKPAIVVKKSDFEIELTIFEGMYHQVKRMMKAVSNEVVRLHRHSIGEIILDASLNPGEYRRLSKEELDILKGSYVKK